MTETLQRMMEHNLVAVIRGAEGEDVLSIARALQEGGVHILEITADTPEVEGLIRKVNEEFGDQMIVGAGTVLDPETARAAIMAGARFIFSPTVNRETIRLTKRYGVVSIPGALTPTEILTAYEHGADLIKVFPAGAMGPSYMKDIHGPLPHIPLMPTGGVDLSNIREYFEKGAVAAGLGSALVNTKQPINAEALKGITDKAQQFVEAIKDV
ncbi:bifunctional 4-hydroxy-2-oxoglutarate aldolase/2-dehydro-3-deoxy-phosphogluconate aldolase [Halobacillus shinanisalinarum]|uniref:Bifunctional 4-hydroxy-2-oxoglutarate aldolase/2-dehydro-3-deoxy-phosphogluconate aldolase n=1 Tax=Halobacillus shinanisalinarum TaxID=2932258 RepID=A0ABY4H2L6_9BACI|nr:bifunctional 4-hydroxy-2-oxoglutarate aldolase/2-dehydro-3-deoxy-phosphogluconate aldolase [Halobacillus shinanisalinarum]UOQ94549.1 bifunctional 4-hydroxy-2-oxoglutarate aldolase/2-dehydro-3-deoxy-phosphogluconate aldolase [Halobacillus shinanisalinarum]